jgi:uncharacterized protein YcfL
MFKLQSAGKLILVFLTVGFLLAGCSSTKEITTTVTQSDCQNERKINNPNEFVSETAQNLDVFQKGDIITATVDIESYCNAQLSFDVVKKENELWLKLKNNSGVKDECVCTKKVSISLANVEAGDYKIVVTNQAGNQLLAQTMFTVK